jgi:hypothetical protein
MSARPATLVAVAAALSLAGALAAEPPAEKAKSREICRAPAKQLGSHIRASRRCRTAEQWQQDDEAKAGLPIGAQVTQGQNDGQVKAQPQ